jgi:hypothetical protein
VKLVVSPDAVKWLQTRASSPGAGGLGKAMVCLYLACRVVVVKGEDTITLQHLENVEHLSMGHEDAERVAEVVAESSGMRRVV